MAGGVIAISSIILALLTVLTQVVQSRRTRAAREATLDRLPLLDGTDRDMLVVTHEGYLKYLKQGRPYRLRIESSGTWDRVMLPLKYLQEVKNSPQNLSFYLSSEIDAMLKYSGSPAQTPALTHTAKSSLNRNLTKLIPLIHNGLRDDISSALPQGREWSPVQLYSTFLTIVGRNTARVIGDPRLSGNDEWVQLSIDFTEHTFEAAHSIRKNYSATTFWLAKWIDGPSRTILKCRRRAAEILKPIYHEHKDRLSSGKSSELTTGVNWLLFTPKREESSLQEVVDDMLLLSLAAIHTTTLTLTAVIRDLVTRPAVYQSLRQEIIDHYPVDGTWTTAQLAKLSLVDSFMKESQRTNFIVLNTVLRAPYQDFEFSDGLVIPARTICEMASHELNMDPDIHPDPDKFDPLRFQDLKSSTTGSNNHNFTSIATDRSINFGAGVNTCPGRHFASATIKMILSELLLNYDLKWENDKGPPSVISSAFTRMVDPTAVIMVRSRT